MSCIIFFSFRLWWSNVLLMTQTLNTTWGVSSSRYLDTMRKLYNGNHVAASCSSQEGRYKEACSHFNTVLQVMGYKADTCYCIALCHYMQNQYAAALKYITEIIERGIKEHPGKKDSPPLIWTLCECSPIWLLCSLICCCCCCCCCCCRAECWYAD